MGLSRMEHGKQVVRDVSAAEAHGQAIKARKGVLRLGTGEFECGRL